PENPLALAARLPATRRKGEPRSRPRAVALTWFLLHKISHASVARFLGCEERALDRDAGFIHTMSKSSFSRHAPVACRDQAALACARLRKSTNTAAISASFGAQSSGGTRSTSRSPGKRS